ncbi:MAG: hypothetical protein Kow0079_08320 [Vicingaceae bacterium]
MKYILCIYIALLNCFAFAANDYSQSNGNWWTGGSWNNSVPSASNCMDSIFIDHTIIVNSTVDMTSCPPVHIIVSDTLEFKTGKKLKLPSGSTVTLLPGAKLKGGGGGGNSNYIEIGGNTVWKARDGDKTGPLTYTESGPLPIELLNFEVNINAEQVDITWTTASETNNDYFLVEKSIDGKSWQVVVKTQGAGNSSQILDYFEVDYEPIEGISYYRLKQVDFNGEYTYSNIVPVKYIPVDQSTSDINIFPNPIIAGEVDLTIEFKAMEGKEILVVLRDIKGQEYYSKVTVVYQDNQIIAVPLQNDLAAGVYLVTATSEDKIYSKKLIVK